MANTNHLKDLPKVTDITEEYQIKDTRDKYGYYHNKRRHYSNIFTIIEVVLVVLLFIFLIMLVTIDNESTLYTVSVALTIISGVLMIIGFIIFAIYLSISNKTLKEEEDTLDSWEKLVRERLQLKQAEESDGSGTEEIDTKEEESEKSDSEEDEEK